MSVICTFMCFSILAQADTTNNINNTNNTSDSNINITPTTTPTMNTTTDTSMNNNQTTMPTMNTNTSGNMNTNLSTSTNSNMNDSAMNSNLVNPNNIPGQTDYAALPVLETFVPDNIVAEVKQKYPNEIIYDITAVKAPVDSSMMHTDSMAMNQNATTDSSMHPNSTMNQNTANNLNNGMATDSTMQMPEKFNYVVRVIQGGQLMTETLESDGTALNAAKNNSLTQ